MNRVAEFEKVSFDQFFTDLTNASRGGYSRDEAKMMHDDIVVPCRSTSMSAGYDFVAPFGFCLTPGESMTIPTGIRVEMSDGWWLMCLPRSSYGFKYKMQLDNTAGVIDGDYYYSDNEGHIMAKITNDTRDYKVMNVNAGDRFMQGILVPYGITYEDDVVAVRNGGLGSTDS